SRNGPQQPLPDYLGYSIFTMLCCCLPLGVAALVFSVNVSSCGSLGAVWGNVSSHKCAVQRKTTTSKV
uniref:Uncharacterized protein n=1 Tax=Pygocentrus nattereri TaxID=42514 RepID=A0AAR2IL67_PYGNA